VRRPKLPELRLQRQRRQLLELEMNVYLFLWSLSFPKKIFGSLAITKM
jgi:hypothetical protein